MGERKEGRKEGRKGGRKGGRKEGRKEGNKIVKSLTAVEFRTSEKDHFRRVVKRNVPALTSTFLAFK